MEIMKKPYDQSKRRIHQLSAIFYFKLYFLTKGPVLYHVVYSTVQHSCWIRFRNKKSGEKTLDPIGSGFTKLPKRKRNPFRWPPKEREICRVFPDKKCVISCIGDDEGGHNQPDAEDTRGEERRGQ